MELSKEILKFMHWLDSRNFGFDAEYIQYMLDDLDVKDREKLERNVEIRLLIRKIVSKYVKSKSAPIVESVEELRKLLSDISGIDELGEIIDDFSKLSDEDLLNTYFTEKSLNEVPKYVGRLRKLTSLKVVRAPGKKIEKYFRQATDCYIYGLYDAVAILSRSVLVFALEEAITYKSKMKNVITLPQEKKGYYKNLIKRAEMAGIITEEDNILCERVVNVGNRAVHANSIDETTACEVIKKTSIILSKVY